MLYQTNCGIIAEDIAELHAQGIEVKDEGPAHKNIRPHTAMTPKLRRRENLRTYPHKADSNATNVQGKFVSNLGRNWEYG